MKAFPRVLTFFIAAAFSVAIPASAQDDDKDVADALKKAKEAAKKMGIKTSGMDDAKKMLDDENKKEAAHKKKQLEAAQKDLMFPSWMPPVPQFKPDGPIAVQKIDDEDLIAQTGTSPLPPEQIADAWYEVAKEGFGRSKSTNNVNGRITIYVNLRKYRVDPQEDIKLTVDRKPEDKITKVTISKNLPEIPDEDDD